MITKEHALIPLFEKFLKDSNAGRRLKTNGARIKPQSTNNYKYVLRYLKEYESKFQTSLRIKEIKGMSKRSFLSEKKYWKKFYLDFTDYLYKTRGCYDNYVGTVIKILRIFFNYLKKDLGIQPGEFHKEFYVCKEEIPIIALLPGQLQFLINDRNFDGKLTPSLKKSKDIFVFGCTVALRVSDLFNIEFRDIEYHGGTCYLPVKTLKTGTSVRIKLPDYAIKIIENFKKTAKSRKQIFPPVPRTRFNDHLKMISALAGWTGEIGKQRTRRGTFIENTIGVNRKKYRFCDLVSSHVMRRTAITTMLMMGMKEHIVKQISGHTNDSKSFYRYVNLAQSYLDNEMDIVFNKLAEAG